MSTENLEKLIKDHKIEFVDLRFTDMRGVQHHVTFPKSIIEPGLFEDGKMFDGSSIAGWKGIHQSDMVLLPDASTGFLDPFTADPTLVLTCDVLDPTTMQAYNRDPRGIARRAQAESLQAIGVDEAILPQLAEIASQRSELALTPPPAGADELLELYRAAW